MDLRLVSTAASAEVFNKSVEKLVEKFAGLLIRAEDSSG